MTCKVKPVLCVGSYHWDEIALSDSIIAKGDDAPGSIRKNPGGVAFNLAKTIREFGIPVILGSVLGDDPEGNQLHKLANETGIDCELIYRAPQKTGKYIAIEDPRGLVAAIADCSTLELNEGQLLEKLVNWKKSRASTSDISGLVIDCNLSIQFINKLLNCRHFNNYPVKIASASNHKINRIRQFDFNMDSTSLYVNNLEARRLLAEHIKDSQAKLDYIEALLLSFNRVIITDGENEIIDADSREVFRLTPQSIQPTRFTGAGDYFMAAHIALELLGSSRIEALQEACNFVRDKIA